jgi:hypothetical protein
MDVDEEEAGSPSEEVPMAEAEPRLTGPSHLHRLLTELGPIRAGPPAALQQEAPDDGSHLAQQGTAAPSPGGRPPPAPAAGVQGGQQQQGAGAGAGEDLEAAVAAALAGPLRSGPTAHDLLLLAAHAAVLEGGWQPASQVNCRV